MPRVPAQRLRLLRQPLVHFGERAAGDPLAEPRRDAVELGLIAEAVVRDHAAVGGARLRQSAPRAAARSRAARGSRDAARPGRAAAPPRSRAGACARRGSAKPRAWRRRHRRPRGGSRSCASRTRAARRGSGARRRRARRPRSLGTRPALTWGCLTSPSAAELGQRAADRRGREVHRQQLGDGGGADRRRVAEVGQHDRPQHRALTLRQQRA